MYVRVLYLFLVEVLVTDGDSQWTKHPISFGFAIIIVFTFLVAYSTASFYRVALSVCLENNAGFWVKRRVRRTAASLVLGTNDMESEFIRVKPKPGLRIKKGQRGLCLSKTAGASLPQPATLVVFLLRAIG